MTTLTPYVRKFLALWGVIWLLGLLFPASDPFGFLALDTGGLADGRLSAIPGIFGYFLLHDPHSILHLLFNAWMFALFAPEMERIFPGGRFLRFTFTVVVLGAALRFLLALLFPEAFGYLVIGASGVTMACLAGYAALFPGTRFFFFFFQVKALTLFLVVVGFDLVSFLLTLAGHGGKVAVDIHLAGAVTGWFLCAGFQRYPFPGRSFLANWRAKRSKQAERNAQSRLDEILAKISDQGIGALSKKEKKFLEERSGKRR